MHDRSFAWRDRNIGRLLFSASALFTRAKLRIFHEGGYGAVTDVQATLIQYLDSEGTRLTTLAERSSMTKQSMLQLVNKVEALGLVERRDDPDDRRARIIAFTPTGLAMLERVREGVADAEARMQLLLGARFLGDARERLAAYVEAGVAASDEIRMADGNAPWRSRSINRVLISATGVFVRDVMRAVHEVGFQAVGPADLALFRALDLQGTRLTVVAARARMTKQAMAELVDKAEALGLVARRPDPGDGRAKMVFFAEAGLTLLDHVRDGIAVAESRLAAITSVEFVSELRELLATYVASAGAPDAPQALAQAARSMGHERSRHPGVRTAGRQARRIP